VFRLRNSQCAGRTIFLWLLPKAALRFDNNHHQSCAGRILLKTNRQQAHITSHHITSHQEEDPEEDQEDQEEEEQDQEDQENQEGQEEDQEEKIRRIRRIRRIRAG
jgi:hypothetical protein